MTYVVYINLDASLSFFLIINKKYKLLQVKSFMSIHYKDLFGILELAGETWNDFIKQYIKRGGDFFMSHA
jgi:hypothetical protein